MSMDVCGCILVNQYYYFDLVFLFEVFYLVVIHYMLYGFFSKFIQISQGVDIGGGVFQETWRNRFDPWLGTCDLK